MSRHDERRHILAYDISDERRLSRVHRRVKRDGVALQYSLFDLHLPQSRLRRLLGDLRDLIDEREDDVRVYGPRLDLPVAWLGVSPMRAGLQLFNNLDDKVEHRLAIDGKRANGDGITLNHRLLYTRAGRSVP